MLDQFRQVVTKIRAADGSEVRWLEDSMISAGLLGSDIFTEILVISNKFNHDKGTEIANLR